MNIKVIAATVLVAAVVGCSSSGDGMNWAQYSTAVQTRIETKIAAHDCAGLQVEFDNADANNRNGINTALMSFLNDQMDELGCYG